VYLHDALDRWFQKVVKPRCRGEACLLRDADDDVAAFQDQADAEHFYRELGPRLGKVGLEVAPDKTRVIPFSGQQARGRTSVDCLGFECRGGTNRAGNPHLKRRTARKTLRRSIQRFTAWCRETCRHRVRDVFRELHANLRGYYRYDGVPGNYPSLQQFFYRAMRILMTWLNRRSQRRSSMWPGFTELLRHFQVERPRLVGRPPRVTSEASAGVRQRVCLKSPVRENCTPGSVRGRPGHWPSYRDGGRAVGLSEWAFSVKRIGQIAAIHRCVCGAFVLLAFLARAGHAEPQRPGFGHVDEFVEAQLREANIPGAALALVGRDGIVYLRGFGSSGPGLGPVTPHTLFILWSVSKAITAMALMQLVEASRVELDTPVRRYPPWFTILPEDDAPNMTVRHILNHTSGLSTADGWTHFDSRHSSDTALEQLVRDLSQARQRTPPGEAFQYS
jgi:hypothetical protein